MSLGKALQTVSDPINKLVDPLAESIGNTVKDLWDLVLALLAFMLRKNVFCKQKL